MSDIVYQHYIGRGPEAEAVIAEANERYTAFMEASDAFKKERGYENVWQGHTMSGPYVGGPVFKEKLDSKGARGKGLVLECQVTEGYGYGPHMGTKLGKELNAALDELSKSAIDRAKYVVKKLDMRHEVYVGRCIAKTTAGFKDGVIVVKVPVGGHTPCKEQELPTPRPGWCPARNPKPWLRWASRRQHVRSLLRHRHSAP